jgi:hypothetical protein
MPYKKEYTMGNVKKGDMKTPASVMGGQGKAVAIKAAHYMSRMTKMTPFPGGKKSK